MKYIGTLVGQVLFVLVVGLAVPVLLFTLLLGSNPNQDTALGVGPALIFGMIILGGLAMMVNVMWLHQSEDPPRWLPWYIRAVLRVAVVVAVFAVLLAWTQSSRKPQENALD